MWQHRLKSYIGDCAWLFDWLSVYGLPPDFQPVVPCCSPGHDNAIALYLIPEVRLATAAQSGGAGSMNERGLGRGSYG